MGVEPLKVLSAAAAALAVLSYVLAAFTPLVSALGVERVLALIPSLCLATLLLLAGFILDYRLFRFGTSRFLELVNSFITSLLRAYPEVSEFIGRQRPGEAVRWGNVNKLLSRPFKVVTEVAGKSLELYLGELHSGAGEGRKRELMERAREGRITRREAEELRALLEKQRREKEKSRDFVGAILAGLSLIFVLQLLSKLSKEEKAASPGSPNNTPG